MRMMRMDGSRNGERPRGAVLGPLTLLLAAAATGYGMWHALMRDDVDPSSTVAHAASDDRLVQDTSH
jgi:hypothetical protein